MNLAVEAPENDVALEGEDRHADEDGVGRPDPAAAAVGDPGIDRTGATDDQ
ncbi:hypothetical protein D3C86_2153480 [compost metagenome]